MLHTEISLSVILCMIQLIMLRCRCFLPVWRRNRPAAVGSLHELRQSEHNSSNLELVVRSIIYPSYFSEPVELSSPGTVSPCLAIAVLLLPQTGLEKGWVVTQACKISDSLGIRKPGNLHSVEVSY